LTEPVDLASYVRDIPDFPKPGILFRDITPLMARPEAFRAAVGDLAAYGREVGAELVIGAEARGFLLGPAVANELDSGFVLARKPGKLPYETVTAQSTLEYGSDRLELHTDAISPGTRVLVHDDLLATGGTARALCSLVEQLGGTVAGCGFLIELGDLHGRDRVAPYDVRSLLRY
jgi:adenine phosphoribosyltransferase